VTVLGFALENGSIKKVRTLPQLNQKRNLSFWFPQFELKVAVKHFRATLN